MSLFGRLFDPIKTESLVFIDITAGSVAGAYAHYSKEKVPSLIYTRRISIEMHEGEAHELAMLRALQTLSATLIREGAPELARQTGSGSAARILVSVDAPWQETKVRTELFEHSTPFVFTKKMVTTALEKTGHIRAGKTLADESIIGTTLNGYETKDPYGRRVHRASVVVLTSLIDTKVADAIVTMLQGLFHRTPILSIAGNSLRYQAMRTVFPHEKNTLILDAIGSLLSISLVREGLLVAVTEMPDDNAEKEVGLWAKKVVDELMALSKEYPLPRTTFLLTELGNPETLEKALSSANFGGLWLSDSPPKLVPVQSGHLTTLVTQVTTAPPDLPLLLMTLYWSHKPKE